MASYAVPGAASGRSIGIAADFNDLAIDHGFDDADVSEALPMVQDVDVSRLRIRVTADRLGELPDAQGGSYAGDRVDKVRPEAGGSKTPIQERRTPRVPGLQADAGQVLIDLRTAVVAALFVDADRATGDLERG
jgi:hypothetical protein